MNMRSVSWGSNIRVVAERGERKDSKEDMVISSVPLQEKKRREFVGPSHQEQTNREMEGERGKIVIYSGVF